MSRIMLLPGAVNIEHSHVISYRFLLYWQDNDVQYKPLGLVILVVIHIEYRLSGVCNTPDHHRGDLDGIAPFVIDLQFVAVKIPDSK
jgi:hypothetical protein